MNTLRVIIVAFVLFSSSYAIADEVEKTLCSSDEAMIVSCQLFDKKSRIVSFCSSPNNETVVYRIGSASAIELETSFAAHNPLSRWVDAFTYTVYLGFRRGKYSYVFGVPQERFGARAFLEVAKDNKGLMSLECTNNSFGDKSLASEAIREVEDRLVRDNKFIFPPEGY